LSDNAVLTWLAKFKLFPKALINNMILDYDDLATAMMAKPIASYLRFPCVTPCWDNSARRKTDAAVFINSTPDKYEEWLADAIQKPIVSKGDGQKIVFINAWNEWAEGNHLEPDQKWGHAYLQATLNALSDPFKKRNDIRKQPHPIAKINAFYSDYIAWRVERISKLLFKN